MIHLQLSYNSNNFFKKLIIRCVRLTCKKINLMVSLKQVFRVIKSYVNSYIRIISQKEIR
jgi:hypothetical protein